MRLNIFLGIIAFIFLILLAGLGNVQIINGARYLVLSEENRIKHIPVDAPRGIIYDRNMEPLVVNRPSFNLLIIPEELSKHPKAVLLLADIMQIDSDYIWDKMNKNKYIGFVPVALSKDIFKKQVAQIEERSIYLPGVFITVSSRREYLKGNFLSHVLGYVGEINSDELKRIENYDSSMGDIIGKDGVESFYDKYLRGQKGGKQVEVTAFGRYERVLGQKDPVKGNDIVLSIDARIQKIVEDVFKDEVGSVVILEPNTGDVLAMCSKPSFDPNVFVDSQKKKELKELLLDTKNKPIMNRSISALYPPGSIFKLVVGMAGLEENIVDQYQIFDCPGWIKIGRIFNCWYDEGHSFQNIVNAIKNSCNVYFYRVGQMLGVDTISKYSSDFGLGKKTYIELPGEKQGLVPSSKWKKQQYKQDWYAGETANFSIGQGYLLVTPLQLARLPSVIATRGVLSQPIIVKKIIHNDGETFDALIQSKKQLGYKKNNFDIIIRGMKAVVNSQYSTGRHAKIKNAVVCGKTGTVQVAGRDKVGKNKSKIPWKLRNHAWFACFADEKNPVLAMSVFVEHGESGGGKAAVVAHDILERIFDEKLR